MGSFSEPAYGLRIILLTFNILAVLMGAAVFGLCVWLMNNSGLSVVMDDMELGDYYIGVYIMLVAIIIYLLVATVGICAVKKENPTWLRVMAGVYTFEWAMGVIGAAILLDHSTYQSKIQPMIQRSMKYLISEAQWDRKLQILTLIQEGIGCCGANGPHDYLAWKKPLPSECRDSVTGNAYFYGCVDQLSWFVEEKSSWLSGLVMFLALLFILKAVMSVLLAKVYRAQQA